MQLKCLKKSVVSGGGAVTDQICQKFFNGHLLNNAPCLKLSEKKSDYISV